MLGGGYLICLKPLVLVLKNFLKMEQALVVVPVFSKASRKLVVFAK
jgi:hypothetical protein